MKADQVRMVYAFRQALREAEDWERVEMLDATLEGYCREPGCGNTTPCSCSRDD